MKYLIATDIHGSEASAKIILEKKKEFDCDKIILLGDILYHGPRNDLPESYNPKKVIELLNSEAKNIIAVKGNCDAEVDQMVLDFKLEDERIIKIKNKEYFLTHGQHTNADKPKKLKKGTVVLHGHTHIIKKTEINGVVYLNIGSITLPKQDHPKCFAVLDDAGVQIYDLKNELVLSYNI